MRRSESEEGRISGRIVAAAVVLIVAAAVAALWQVRHAVRQAAAIERLERENTELRRRAESLAKENERLLAEPRQPAAAPQAGVPVSPQAGREATPGLDTVRTLIETRERLAKAAAAITDLEFRVHELESSMAKLASDNQRLTNAEIELKERMANAGRLAEALQAELKTRNERVVELEVALRKLRDQNAGLTQKVSALTRNDRDFEELNRRREMYLTSILQRYRDLTEQYRAIAIRLDDPGERRAPAPGELSRIQNTISMAEEDLKQLANLNAQAAALLKKR